MGDSVEDVFDYGYCHALALALHHKTGWPIVGLRVKDDRDIFPNHVLVQRPDGALVDVHGARPERDVRLSWSSGDPDRWEVRPYGSDFFRIPP